MQNLTRAVASVSISIGLRKSCVADGSIENGSPFSTLAVVLFTTLRVDQRNTEPDLRHLTGNSVCLLRLPPNGELESFFSLVGEAGGRLSLPASRLESTRPVIVFLRISGASPLS